MTEMTLTETGKKEVGFYAPVLAAAGAFAGIFVGAAQGSMLLGILGGAVLLAALAYVGVEHIGLAHERM